MQETICVRPSQRRKKKEKYENSIPTINRTDIMSGILSTNINQNDRYKLANLYAEITYMEKTDLKYINQITVSCQSDMEIYEILKKIKKEKKKQLSMSKRASG